MEEYKKLIDGVAIILPENEFKEKFSNSIATKNPLRVKLGFDPTSPDLHLGHFVVLKKLRDFQELGHEINIIIGSFTAMIGDPTGKNKTRPPLTSKKVDENSKTYTSQLDKVLDIDKFKIHYNHTWFNDFNGEQICELFSKYTINKLLTREDFSNRMSNKTDIHTHELIYPLLQGYDSVKIKADIEIGGTDQLFNMQVGRHLQESSNEKTQCIICMPLLRGLDGENKMSKSLNNYIGLTEDANSIREKISKLPSELLSEYINLITDFPIEEKKRINEMSQEQPEVVKKILAENIIKQLKA
jgi:tyrosyl-tRNA synthetase